MRLIAAAALAGVCLATSPLFAADLDGMPPPMDQPQQSGELGTNWYIRGDVGYGFSNQATVDAEDSGLFPTIGNQPIGNANTNVPFVRGDNQSTWTPDVGLGFGYRVNDWFRIEADWAYSKGPGLSTQKTVYCPETTTAASNYSYATSTTGVAIPVGYQYDYTTCLGSLNVNQYNNTGLVMGYFDLGHWGIFSPYVGAGGGMNVNTISGKLNFTQTDTGATYAGVNPVNGTAPAVWVTQTGVDQNGNPVYGDLPKGSQQRGASQPIGPGNWYRSLNATKYSFAASGAIGLGIQISQSATLDLGYHITSLDLSQGWNDTLQTITLGVRYNLN
jgi:hypothetical protein